MAMRILIGQGSDLITLEEAGKFEYSYSEPRNQRGDIESRQHLLEFEGIVKDDPMVSLKELLESIRNSASERPVQVINTVTSEVLVDLKPSDGYVGPFITSFAGPIAEDGAGTSHARYRLSIFFREKGTADGGSNSPVYELSSSIETIKEYGQVTKKIWTVSASAKDISQAKTKVESFKPSIADEKLIVATKTYKHGAHYEAQWTWEARRVHWIEEECDLPSSGSDYEIVGSASSIGLPEAYKTRNKEAVITISGTAFGFANDVALPPAHFKESSLMLRPRARQKDSGPEVHNAERGIWRRRYVEVWIYLGLPPIPLPNHGDHGDSKITFDSDPADGDLGAA